MNISMERTFDSTEALMVAGAPKAIQKLSSSAEPSLRYRFHVRVLGESPGTPANLALQGEIKTSALIQRLLSECDGQSGIAHHPYAKWDGAHWVLAQLAELGYPPGDPALIILREQELAWLFGANHQKQIQSISGRVRRCASQEGNALFALLTLGLADERTDQLAHRLLQWQWPDGGWNCDRRPEASHSSFMESLIPLRGLALHARMTDSQASAAGASRAAEIFLRRELFRRQHDGAVIDADFLRLHYPCYWHYDILFALKVMAEAGFIHDQRCATALDVLQAKQLPDGGFPAERRYYQLTAQRTSGRSLVDWGGVNHGRSNPWVTLDALYVLRMAGRWSPEAW